MNRNAPEAKESRRRARLLSRTAASIERDAAANLRTRDVEQRRAATLRQRFATEPEFRQRVVAAMQDGRRVPEKAAAHRASLQAAWDGNDERKAKQSATISATFTNGTQVKSACPFGCGMTTFPGPMGRHIKAKHPG